MADTKENSKKNSSQDNGKEQDGKKMGLLERIISFLLDLL